MRRLAILAVLLALSPAARGEEESGARGSDAGRAPSAQALAQLARRGAAILERTESQRAHVEAARLWCRRAERAEDPTEEQRSWRARWSAGAGARDAILRALTVHAQAVTATFREGSRAEGGAAGAKAAWDRASGAYRGVLARWISSGEPDSSLALAVRTSCSLPERLVVAEKKEDRRDLLVQALRRAAATPGQSDLDVLTHVVGWERLFRRRLDLRRQLELVSRDLVVLFTERAENGLTRSGLRYYGAGRFRDRGFARRFRDGSDQVRHFAWAFRMFAMSNERESTARMLSEKELADARTRKQPVNEADLALNRAARTLVERLRSDPEVLDADWGPLFREALGEPARGK